MLSQLSDSQWEHTWCHTTCVYCIVMSGKSVDPESSLGGFRIIICSSYSHVYGFVWGLFLVFFLYTCHISAFTSYLQSPLSFSLCGLIYSVFMLLRCLPACALNNQLNSTDNPTLFAHKKQGLVSKAQWLSTQRKFIRLQCSSS